MAPRAGSTDSDKKVDSSLSQVQRFEALAVGTSRRFAAQRSPRAPTGSNRCRQVVLPNAVPPHDCAADVGVLPRRPQCGCRPFSFRPAGSSRPVRPRFEVFCLTWLARAAHRLLGSRRSRHSLERGSRFRPRAAIGAFNRACRAHSPQDPAATPCAAESAASGFRWP